MSKIISLPGLIDPHVHLREPGATHKEDFETGTKAAIAGGYTLVLDMPNNPVATISPEALQQKIDLARGRVYCDTGFHFGASGKSVQYFKEVANKVYGLKVYMNQTTGDLLLENDKILQEVFFAWPRHKPILVHAEGETLSKAIALASKFGSKLHICHVSLKEEVEAIKSAKKLGLRVSCEVTCHHLFLTQEDAKRLGPFGVMRPPLVSQEDQEALWGGIADGTIDMIASDHAPHTKEEKSGEKPPFGVPGLETTLPLLLTAVSDCKLTIERLVELTSANPRRIFDIPEQQDTFTEIEITKPYPLNPKPYTLYTKCGWTPFAGMKVTGKVKKVVLRGKLVYDGQKTFGPYGQVLHQGIDREGF